MATTDILPFAIDAGSDANLEPLVDYATDASRETGFQQGLADQLVMNRAWRQAAFMAAGLAGFCVAQNISVPDDGNLANLVTEIEEALGGFIQGAAPDYGADSGTASHYVVTLTPVPASYKDGMSLRFFATHASAAGGSTVNAGAGVVPLLNANGNAVGDSEIALNALVIATYRATLTSFCRDVGGIGGLNLGNALSADAVGNVNVVTPSISVFNFQNFV